MVRGAIIAIALAGAASPALACTMIFPDLPDGLTDTQIQAAYYRWFYHLDVANQRRQWANADYVFVAQVRYVRMVDDDENYAGLRPISILKGSAGYTATSHRYDTGVGNTCGPDFAYPAVGDFGIFYARKAPWWRRWLPWGRMDILYVVPANQVLDQRLPIEMRAAAARLRKPRNP